MTFTPLGTAFTLTNACQFFVGHRLGTVAAATIRGTGGLALPRIALAAPNTAHLRHPDFPDRYLRHSDHVLCNDPPGASSSPSTRRDATFRATP
ncbi:hypothetical protein AB0425_32985 [Actinosynnema sp. NPDC051121]